MKNICKPLLKNNGVLKMIFLLSWLFSFHGLTAQPQKPISKQEVQTLKKKEKKLWYVDAHPKLSENTSNAGTSGKYNYQWTLTPNSNVMAVIKYLAWLIAAVAIAGVIYLIVNNWRDWKLIPNEEVGSIITETTPIESTEQLYQIGYEKQIQLALEHANWRLAVRLYYLWTLQKLSRAGFIDFRPYKTNLDYCQELQATDFLPLFRQCTRNYDYVWFGNFTINQSTFGKIETTFKELLTKKL